MRVMKHYSRNLQESGQESGSVLILVLLAMLLLSFMGLALVLVTETEMQLGGSEMMIAGTFYSAESGASVAQARVLDGACAPTLFFINDSGASATQLGYVVGLSRNVPISVTPCDFCQVNEDDSSWSQKVTYLVNSTATRRDLATVDRDTGESDALLAAEGAIQTHRGVAVTFLFEPSEEPLTQCMTGAATNSIADRNKESSKMGMP